MCPTQTTTYTLRVNSSSGTQDRTVTLTVGASGTPAAVEFTADATQVNKGQCTVLHWRALDVSAVYLNNGGVAGESSQQVCPEVTTPYELRVVNNDGTTITKRITVSVVPAGDTILRFWADQYTMAENACTTLTWNIQNVQEVYLDDQPQAGQDSESVCPRPNQSYSVASDRQLRQNHRTPYSVYDGRSRPVVSGGDCPRHCQRGRSINRYGPKPGRRSARLPAGDRRNQCALRRHDGLGPIGRLVDGATGGHSIEPECGCACGLACLSRATGGVSRLLYRCELRSAHRREIIPALAF